MAECSYLNQDVSPSLCWNHCPSEILYTIFSKLDNKSLLTCLSVSKHWRAIADSIIQYNRGWKILAKADMVCGGVTFKKKSKLDWRDIYMNSLLWQNVSKADILHVCTYYDNMCILNINIYKDNLIVVTSSGVKYYDVETYEFKKEFNMMSCFDFNESDHMMIIITEVKPFKGLSLFGKIAMDDDSRSDEHRKFIFNVLLYRLEGDTCYVLAPKNILWHYKWDGMTWNSHLRARYYGNECSIQTLHVHRDEVYLLLSSGDILFNDTNSMSFSKLCGMILPRYINDTAPVMFERCSIVCGVPDYKNPKMKYMNNVDSFLMECPGLSCATQHGHVLFLGFNTGTVQICIPQRNEKLNNPELNLDIRDFDTETNDFEIKALDVYEVKDRHHLFIGTRTCIYQVLISYCNAEVF